jgi:predicted O-methyltransferase YrrM
MTLEETHARVLNGLRERPLAWDPRLAPWIPEDRFPQALLENSQGYYLYLHALVQVLEPSRVLELGTCEGGSAFFMMLALPETGRLATVDVGPRHPWQLEPFLEDPRLRRLVGDDLDFGIYGNEPPEELDLLFVDTLHEYGHVRRELDLYLPRLKAGGFLVMDDLHLNEGMERAWAELPLEKLDLGGQFHWSGFGIAQRG